MKPLGAENLMLDLICVTSPFKEVWNSRIQFEISGRQMTVVSRAGLRTMKQISNRPQDLVDLEKLDEPAD